MADPLGILTRQASGVAFALGERPLFGIGERVRIGTRSPIGHYRVPIYLRGKTGVVEAIVTPVAVDNEAEGFGRDAGMKRHYYRLAVPMTEVWENYSSASGDSLHIEVFESWLEKVS